MVINEVKTAMGKDACRIKGTRHGLTISILDDTELPEIIEQLRRKLLSARDFFAGASVSIEYGEQVLEEEQIKMIEETIVEFGMVLDNQMEKTDFVPVGHKYLEGQNLAMGNKDEEVPTILVRRTLRSGQKIHYDGNVVIMGDVNPGAEIVCGGDILVLGSLRGVAHAGVKGNTNSVVFAFRFEPTQLRIAHYISRAPDEKLPHPMGPEVASIVDNLIQIHSYSH